MATKVPEDNNIMSATNNNNNAASSSFADLLSDEQKVIECVIKLLQKKQGFLSINDIHQHLLKNEAALCQVFNFSSEGLNTILSKAILQGGPTYFNACIINHLLYLISILGKKKMKTIVQELSKDSTPKIVMHNSMNIMTTKIAEPVNTKLTAQVLITCLNILEEQPNGMPMDELYRLLNKEREDDMKGTVLENSLATFQRFVVDHPAEFSLTADGCRVYSLANSNSDEEAKAVLAIKMSVLLKNGTLNIKSLMGHLSAFANVRAVTGGSVESLQKFLLQHPETFVVDANGDVGVVGRRISPELTKTGSSEYYEGNNNNSIQKRLKAAAAAQPNRKAKNGNRSTGPMEFAKGPTPPLEIVNSNRNAQARNPAVKYCQSVVVSVFLKFGFIQNGEKEDENIYFDSLHFVHSSYSAPVVDVDDLKTCLKVGDMVDCLFSEDTSSHKTKFRACIVWKVPTLLGNELCLLPIYELPFTVLLGSATVSFLNGSVGSCKVTNERKDALIDLDAKNKIKVSSVGFHLDWLMPSKNLMGQLKIGSQIGFIAKPIVKVSGCLSSHWVAISLWNKRSRNHSIAGQLSPTKRVVRAEVRGLTSDGGVMGFGGDNWAHRATFYWETLADSISKFLTLSVGDSYWCVISEANETSNLGSTKWKVNQLVPYDLNDNGNPPLILRQYPLGLVENSSSSANMNVNNNSISLLDLTDIVQATTLPAAAIPKSADVTNSTAASMFDANLIDLSNLTSNLSMSCTSLSGIGLSEYNKASINNGGGAVVIEDGVGTVISRDEYGGMIEGVDKDVICFGAHAFYLKGRPISHLAFPERTSVHFQARADPKDPLSLVADKVWIGKKPT